MNLFFKLLLIAMFFVANSIQQDASFKCEQESFRVSAFVSSYYDRSARYKCTFERIQSLDDVTNTQKNSPALSNQRVVTIVFLNSSLSQLPDKIFTSYPSVKKIDASQLVLKDIASTAFFDLKFLDLIDLSNNYLARLNARTFASMQIKYLDLSMNLIEAIDDMTFVGADIEKLNLAHNKLKSIRFINSFNFFNIMELNNNAIETFNKIEVKKDAWVNRNGIFGDPEYPKFFLQYNKLVKIDCSSSIRINLLTLEDNPQLSEISLNQCPVDKVDVSNCGNLKKVAFNDNLLGFTAKNVKFNDIEVSEAKSLTTLSLANSSLSQGLFDKITKMENLTFLDLSYINIGPLNISTFAKLKSLQFLYLKATNISNIQFGTFSHQHAVKIFDISENHLGYFDMNMIFSMSSLLSLDISGNDLTSLKDVETAHFTFTLLEKIDLSNNKWPCSYLMKLIKIFRVYKVAMTRSNLEESGTNIHGVSCVHIDGDDTSIESLSSENTNLTDFREKLNEIIVQVTKNAQFGINIDARLKQLEGRVDNQVNNAAISAAFQAERSQNIEVRNSVLLESALVIVCICCAAFIAVKLFVYVKRNFLGRPRQMRASSEHTLTMAVDDY